MFLQPMPGRLATPNAVWVKRVLDALRYRPAGLAVATYPTRLTQVGGGFRGRRTSNGF